MKESGPVSSQMVCDNVYAGVTCCNRTEDLAVVSWKLLSRNWSIYRELVKYQISQSINTINRSVNL